MTEKREVEEFLQLIIDKEELILASLSSPFSTEKPSKITLRPLIIKGEQCYQMTEQRDQQVFHQNLKKEQCVAWLKNHVHQFKQSFFYSPTGDYHLLIGKKGNMKLMKKAPSKSVQVMPHNRQKQYILKEGHPYPFLVRLGVTNAQGKVYPAKSDKFRQINRFLEMIDDILPHLDSSGPLRIIDFGCGKAYLTFALYHFLKVIKGFEVALTGIDLKQEVIQDCQSLAEELGYQKDLQFIRMNIDQFQTEESVDLVISLHACDTATDAALEKAIRWQSKVILCVPCCQHELFNQIRQDSLAPLLKHGILKERFAALVTDAARVQLLEVLGYHAQILEFIDMEHTPKNLLIRATRRTQSDEKRQAALQTYLQFKKTLNIHPSLEQRFQTLL